LYFTYFLQIKICLSFLLTELTKKTAFKIQHYWELKRGAFQSRRVHFHDGSIYFSRAICKIALFPRYLQLIPEWETVAKLFHTGPDRLPNTDTRSALASFVTLANKKAWPPRWQRYYKAGCANAYAHPPDEFSRCSLAITVGISRVIKNDG